MSADAEAFAKKEAARLRAMKCDRCDSDGWLPPLGPYSDGSYITSRPCPNRCAEHIEDAIRFETGKW